jgi:hypothetical protein
MARVQFLESLALLFQRGQSIQVVSALFSQKMGHGDTQSANSTSRTFKLVGLSFPKKHLPSSFSPSARLKCAGTQSLSSDGRGLGEGNCIRSGWSLAA